MRRAEDLPPVTLNQRAVLWVQEWFLEQTKEGNTNQGCSKV